MRHVIPKDLKQGPGTLFARTNLSKQHKLHFFRSSKSSKRFQRFGFNALIYRFHLFGFKALIGFTNLNQHNLHFFIGVERPLNKNNGFQHFFL